MPAEVEAAARQRSEARAARDWPTADRLRDEIEAAGWRVVDSGTSYRLEAASPPDIEVGGEIRYGRSDAVPSRLDEPAAGLASVVMVASPDMQQTRASLAGLRASAPPGVDVIVVADGLSDRTIEPLRPDLAADGLTETELIRTSEPLGHAAALNAGIRRARGPVVVVLDPSIVPAGDVVTPLVDTLADPGVAIAGPFGLRSDDLRRFDEVAGADDTASAIAPAATAGPANPAAIAGPANPSATAKAATSSATPGAATQSATAVQGYLMAFRRADYIARGPLDEGFRFYRNLDIWWSLVLRDEGEDTPPRRAAVVPGLALERHDPHAWTATPPADRDRLSKRNFYRVLDRFRTRPDLAG